MQENQRVIDESLNGTADSRCGWQRGTIGRVTVAAAQLRPVVTSRTHRDSFQVL